MGRGKITYKCIQNKRECKQAFMQRKNGLVKKMSKFMDTYEVEACLIVYEDEGDARPVICPQDPAKVRSIIDKYEAQKNERHPKNFDVEEFFENKKNEIKAKISRMQKDVVKIKYPTWDSSFNSLDEHQLTNLIAMVSAKIASCDQQIGMLKSFDQQTMAHESNSAAFAASNPSQANFIGQDMSQIPSILSHNNNQLAPHHDMGSQFQMPLFDSNFNNQVDVPLDRTKQSGAVVDSTNQLGEPMDWAKFGEYESWENQPSEQVDWTEFGDFENLTGQPSQLLDWNSQLHDSDFHDIIPSQPLNVPQPPMDTFPPTMDHEVNLTGDYNNEL